MKSLDEYGKKFPELVYDMYMFFTNSEIKSKSVNFSQGKNVHWNYKCSIDFCNYYKDKYYALESPDCIIQPNIVKKICDILCENRFLNNYKPARINDFNDWLVFYGNDRKHDNIPKDILVNLLNNITYGFKYIYHKSKDLILPVFVKKDGEQNTGTCFKTIYGIVTAKHCIEDFDAVQIGTMNSNLLNDAEIITQGNMDLVVIIPKENILTDYFGIEKGDVLDEIMAMGFPQHGGFENFVTATIGTIAAIENSYLCKHELMLLTTRLKGGNSGGPIINRNGRVVGVITDTPMSEGKLYDQFGYGMAIPLHNVDEIIKKREKYRWKVKFVNDINA